MEVTMNWQAILSFKMLISFSKNAVLNTVSCLSIQQIFKIRNIQHKVMLILALVLNAFKNENWYNFSKTKVDSVLQALKIVDCFIYHFQF